MSKKNKKIWQNIKLWLPLAIIFGLVVWINAARLKNNIYANHEKAVDYGRVREEKEEVKPIISAIFYADKERNGGQLLTYLDHSRNYKKSKVKMLVVPKFLTPDSFETVEKLYGEIHKYNKLDKVALVYDGEGDVEQHKVMLQDVMGIEQVKALLMTETNLQTESEIERYLQEQGAMVVFLADLAKGIEQENSDFLAEEAIYQAQKNAYMMNVFDVIDTQLAKALEKDYATLLSLPMGQDVSKQMRQKQNLTRYVNKYGKELLAYFKRNVSAIQNKQPTLWPAKSEETYRLYDRGTVYVVAQNFEKLLQNDSVIEALIKLARRVVDRKSDVNSVKMYLLTSKAPVDASMRDLEDDDGVFVMYKSYKAVILPTQRAQGQENLAAALRKKAAMPQDIDDANVQYYKFKAVEISDED